MEEKERRRSCKQPEKEDSDEFVNVWPTDSNSPQRSLHISTKLDDPLNLQRTFYLPDTHLQVKSIHASFLITATIPKDFPTPTSWEQWMRAATSSTARLCERENSHWHPDPAHEWACTKAFVCVWLKNEGKEPRQILIDLFTTFNFCRRALKMNVISLNNGWSKYLSWC